MLQIEYMISNIQFNQKCENKIQFDVCFGSGAVMGA